MKLRIDLFPGALADMDSIWDYSVARWGEDQARSYLKALNTRMRGLCDFPMMGVAQDWLHPGLRRIGEGSHSIYYIVGDGVIGIVRVLHERTNGCRSGAT